MAATRTKKSVSSEYFNGLKFFSQLITSLLINALNNSNLSTYSIPQRIRLLKHEYNPIGE